MKNPIDIITTVEKYYNLPRNSIFKHCRTKTLAEARLVAMSFCRRLTTLSYPEIADIFNKHQSTVIKNLQSVKRRLAVDEEYKKRYKTIEARIV